MRDKIVNEQVEKMNEMQILLTTFGDEPITLMDQYERVSFEVQLNRAILGRSLSESCVPRTRAGLKVKSVFLPPGHDQGPKQKKRHGFGFRKVLGKLLKPIFSWGSAKKEGYEAKDPKILKVFSKSMRV